MKKFSQPTTLFELAQLLRVTESAASEWARSSGVIDDAGTMRPSALGRQLRLGRRRSLLQVVVPIVLLAAVGVFAVRRAQANASAIAGEDVPRQMTYRGHIEDAGQPGSGSYDLRVTLWTAQTGGTCVFTNNLAAVPLVAGDFAVDLGDCTAGGQCVNGAGVATTLPAVMMANTGSLYIGLELRKLGTNAFVAMADRQLVASVPSAVDTPRRPLGYWKQAFTANACDVPSSTALWNPVALTVVGSVPVTSRLEVRYNIPTWTWGNAGTQASVAVSNGPISLVPPTQVNQNWVVIGTVPAESIWTGKTFSNGLLPAAKTYTLRGVSGAFTLRALVSSGFGICAQPGLPAGQTFIEVTAYAE